MIHYLVNKSASKRAQGNVNSKALWFNNEPLAYVSMTMLHYGVQLDADHDKDAGEITQPTQAITALEQGGNLHHLSKESIMNQDNQPWKLVNWNQILLINS